MCGKKEYESIYVQLFTIPILFWTSAKQKVFDQGKKSIKSGPATIFWVVLLTPSTFFQMLRPPQKKFNCQKKMRQKKNPATIIFWTPLNKFVDRKKKWWWWYYPHSSKDSVSPICSIFLLFGQKVRSDQVKSYFDERIIF